MESQEGWVSLRAEAGSAIAEKYKKAPSQHWCAFPLPVFNSGLCLRCLSHVEAAMLISSSLGPPASVSWSDSVCHGIDSMGMSKVKAHFSDS